MLKLIQINQSSGCKFHSFKRHSHVPQVFWDGDEDLVEGVSRGRAVGVEGPDAVCCDNLVVCGVARCVFDHIELKTENTKEKDF